MKITVHTFGRKIFIGRILEDEKPSSFDILANFLHNCCSFPVIVFSRELERSANITPKGRYSAKPIGLAVDVPDLPEETAKKAQAELQIKGIITNDIFSSGFIYPFEC